ncbi:MAG: MATE family efflux transporter [Clostridiales bacterium]|nr:MATE family efflux transporter [Clostridiales bacterium]
MKNTAMDLTQGRPITQILLFSLPLVLGTLFQQLYSFVDTVMVGRIVGTEALAAVGATYPLNFLILGFVQGACIGFAVPLGKATGAHRSDEFQRSFWNGCWLGLVTFLVMTAATLLLAGPLLRLIQTPEDIFSDATTYIRIIFLGLPASALYNYLAATLRASGDSTRPFWFLLASSFLNIALDYIFMAVLRMGVAGAAWATVTSQLVSGLLCLWWLTAKTNLLRGSGQRMGLSRRHLRELAVIGYPMGLEYSVSAVGAVVMQGALNTFGTVAVAGQTAGEKIRQMFTLPMESVGMGMVTYVSQNDGAGRTDRIWQGLRAGLTIQWSYCAAAWVVIYFGKPWFTQLVLGTSTSPEAAYSIQYLGIISTLFCLHGALMIFRNTLQGMGYSVYAIFSGAGELIGRTIGGWLAVTVLGFTGICLANPMAWGLALCYSAGMVFHFLRRRERSGRSDLA